MARDPNLWTEMRQAYVNLRVAGESMVSAFEKAGYKCYNSKGIRFDTRYIQSQAREIEGVPWVKQEIRRLRIDNAELALERLHQVANTSPAELVNNVIDSCRFCWGTDNKYQRTAREMADQREQWEKKLNRLKNSNEEKDRELASEMGEFDEKGGIGYNPTKGPNPKCEECFGRGVPVVVLADTRYLSDGAISLYAGVKQTDKGIEMKIHDQNAARMAMAKHHGLLVDKVEHSGKIDVEQLTADQREAEIRAILTSIGGGTEESDS